AVSAGGVAVIDRDGELPTREVVSGNYRFATLRNGLLLAARNDRIDLYDLADPDAPRFLTHLVTGVSEVRSLHEFAGAVYAGTSNGLLTGDTPFNYISDQDPAYGAASIRVGESLSFGIPAFLDIGRVQASTFEVS